MNLAAGLIREWSAIAFLSLAVSRLGAAQDAAVPPPNTAVVLAVEGTADEVQFQRRGAARWDRAYTNLVLDAGDWFRTGPRSRALLKLSNRQTVRMNERGLFLVPEDAPRGRAIEFIKGLFYFLHRDKPGQLEIRTRLVNSVVRGTEFVLEVQEDGTTDIHLIDGVVAMTNATGGLELRSGESARVVPGGAPTRTASIQAINVIQWCLYYPGVLDVDELPLSPEEQRLLADSLRSWREGDLLAALAQYPANRETRSNAEKIYFASLLLGVGQVEQAEAQLDAITGSVTSVQEVAQALRRTIGAVQGRAYGARAEVRLATSWLAESYVLQAEGSLEPALAAALKASQLSTNFGFAEARVAELEFSFGRIPAARRAVARSLIIAPRNAQAVALEGFLLAAQGAHPQAFDAFNRALAIDPALGNAWLGRGLCRIRNGDIESGLDDIQAAATVEPQRAVLRSYLGKAFYLAGDRKHATNELQLAKSLDSRDPTAWFYSALLLQQENRINEAIRDLEHSQELNENRRIYRSRLLLEQDEAVRGVNLASIYQDAGMTDLSLREAARSVHTDYSSYSAHLFLANSYDQLRDPRQINLRYETAWLNEYLMANLLAPAAAGVFSPALSQQEYARLFERDGFGLASSTEYYSRGDWVQSGVQYGISGKLSYSIEENYRSETGHRPNNDLELLTLSARVKAQLTPQDSLFFQAIWYNAESGDVTPLYRQSDANLGLRVKEREEPLAFVGYHREWSPGSHTLALFGRLQDDLLVRNTNQQTLLVERDFDGNVAFVSPQSFDQRYRSGFSIYDAELQQIWESGDHRFVGGGRYQWGRFDTRNEETNPAPGIPFDADQRIRANFARGSAYGYWTWTPLTPLSLIGGVSYDYLTYPENYRYAPLGPGEQATSRVSPKAGLIWTPAKSTTVRAAYAQALGGVSFDQSFQLEPSQVAGFNQAYRSIIPEAVAGANAAARFEIAGLSLEHKFATQTYLGLTGEWLRSKAHRTFGVVEFAAGFEPAGTPENFRFNERAVTATINQLVGSEWSLGARYRLAVADLEHQFPLLVPFNGFTPSQKLSATLHQLNLFTIYNHPRGWVVQADGVWSAQANHGYASALPGDAFWQFNVFAGYRFARRHAEVRLGLLNLTDRDYQLNPLNLTSELPHSRTFYASLKFNF